MSFTKVSVAGIGTTGTIILTNVSVAGVITATGATFSGNVSVGGTLTYEDVTNVDSVGLITARSGILVTGGGGINLSGGAGVVTATTYRVGTATTLDASGLSVTAGVVTATRYRVGTATTLDASGLSVSAGVVTATTYRVGTATTLDASGLSVTAGVVTATTYRVGTAATLDASGLSVSAGIITATRYRVGTATTLDASGLSVSAGVVTATTYRVGAAATLDASGLSVSAGIITATRYRVGTATTLDASGLSVSAGVVTTTTLRIGGGSTAAPSITPTGDSDTGIFFPSADTIAFGEGGSEAARIDSSGRLLVGTATASSGAPTGGALIQGTGSAAGPITLQIDATPAAAGTDVGLIRFTNSSGSLGAQIKCVSDGSWTNGSNHRSRLEFSTTPDGSSSPAERMRLDSAGSMVLASGTAFVAPYVHNTTTATAANVNVDATGFLRRSTSSIKYKTNIETIEDQYADAILNCRPVWYQSTCDADKPEWGYWGFIAEEVAEIDPRLCFFKEEEDGTLEPEGVQYDRFVPHLLNLIKRQGEAIADLQAEVAALKTQ